jgi:hypothetical protein
MELSRCDVGWLSHVTAPPRRLPKILRTVQRTAIVLFAGGPLGCKQVNASQRESEARRSQEPEIASPRASLLQCLESQCPRWSHHLSSSRCIQYFRLWNPQKANSDADESSNGPLPNPAPPATDGLARTAPLPRRCGHPRHSIANVPSLGGCGRGWAHLSALPALSIPNAPVL